MRLTHGAADPKFLSQPFSCTYLHPEYLCMSLSIKKNARVVPAFYIADRLAWAPYLTVNESVAFGFNSLSVKIKVMV